MQGISQLKTQRLRLRQWQESDLEPFADMNADEEVMKFFPSTYDREETRQAIQKYSERITENGWGFWAAQRLEDCAFVGIIGLHRVDDLPLGDSVEVGWRLARSCWGLGYATEGAFACLDFAFTKIQLEEVVAITTLNNRKSQAVMTRLGMRDSGENFLHPRVPAESGLKEHVLFKITRRQFLENRHQGF